MSGRTLYIEEHEHPDDPVAGCDCGWKGTAGKCESVTDGALTAGDQSPVGRCPECDCFTYLDRPVDRVQDAAREIVRTTQRGYPPGDANVAREIERLRAALEAACPGFAFTITADAAHLSA